MRKMTSLCCIFVPGTEDGHTWSWQCPGACWQTRCSLQRSSQLQSGRRCREEGRPLSRWPPWPGRLWSLVFVSSLRQVVYDEKARKSRRVVTRKRTCEYVASCATLTTIARMTVGTQPCKYLQLYMFICRAGSLRTINLCTARCLLYAAWNSIRFERLKNS